MNQTLKKVVTNNRLLSVNNYFFVLKKDMVFNSSFQSTFANDDIAVASFGSKSKAEVFKRLLEAEGFIAGQDFIEGFHPDGKPHLLTNCEWLDFVRKDNEFFVQYKMA